MKPHRPFVTALILAALSGASTLLGEEWLSLDGRIVPADWVPRLTDPRGREEGGDKLNARQLRFLRYKMEQRFRRENNLKPILEKVAELSRLVPPPIPIAAPMVPGVAVPPNSANPKPSPPPVDSPLTASVNSAFNAPLPTPPQTSELPPTPRPSRGIENLLLGEGEEPALTPSGEETESAEIRQRYLEFRRKGSESNH